MNRVFLLILLFPAVSLGQNTCPCPPPPPQSSVSIWPATVIPKLIDSTATGGIEVGVKFQSSSPGIISGIRFYKASTNTGTHIGNLWTSAGVLLATTIFTGESSSGWQQSNFTTPVSILANTIYIASVFDPAGHFSDDRPYFTVAITNGPLTAVADSTSPNGVYTIGAASSFPRTSNQQSNFWIDLSFVPVAPVPLPPVFTSPLMASGIVGTAFNYQMAASNTPTSYSAVGLPAGLVLNSTGLISGVPTTAATTTITLTANNTVGSGTANLILTVSAAPVHSMTISWNASPTPNVSYSIYRGTVAGGESSTALNTSPITTLSYSDANVSSGQKLCYVVKAIGSLGTSIASNESCATIP